MEMEIDVQMSRIAQAFERIADSIERIESEGLTINTDIDTSLLRLEGPLCVQHEFASDSLSIKGKLFLEPDEREGFSVKLSK